MVPYVVMNIKKEKKKKKGGDDDDDLYWIIQVHHVGKRKGRMLLRN